MKSRHFSLATGTVKPASKRDFLIKAKPSGICLFVVLRQDYKKDKDGPAQSNQINLPQWPYSMKLGQNLLGVTLV